MKKKYTDALEEATQAAVALRASARINRSSQPKNDRLVSLDIRAIILHGAIASETPPAEIESVEMIVFAYGSFFEQAGFVNGVHRRMPNPAKTFNVVSGFVGLQNNKILGFANSFISMRVFPVQILFDPREQYAVARRMNDRRFFERCMNAPMMILPPQADDFCRIDRRYFNAQSEELLMPPWKPTLLRPEFVPA